MADTRHEELSQRAFKYDQMSTLVKHAATAITLILVVVAVLLLVSGRFFSAGFVLTLVAFSIYFRAINS